jgi:hypothetical protein
VTAIDHAPALPSARRVGQATVVEQSRAVAEVQAAVLVAQHSPRDQQRALAAMRQSCGMQRLADRAFFRYSRAGSTITGPSVYLARELARCWGNLQHGIAELSRDDEHGQSEMQAFAWDLETNTRVTTTFIVPHARDKDSKIVKLSALRDIYENNANAGARRVRECIFGVLPPWFTQEAQDLCTQTLEKGGGEPLPTRIANMLARFEVLGITGADIERKLGRKPDRFTVHDLAQLATVYQSLQRGEVTRDEEFPPPVVTAAEITGQRQSEPPPVEPAEEEATAPTRKQSSRLHAVFGELGLGGVKKRDDRLAILADLMTRPVASSSDLTDEETTRAADILSQLRSLPDRELALAELIERGRAVQAVGES